MLVCLQVASAGCTESIILSAGSADSMDTLSTSAESIILSVLPPESMMFDTLSADWLCYYANIGG